MASYPVTETVRRDLESRPLIRAESRPSYPVTETVRRDLDKRFTYHAPHGDQPDRYQRIRAQAKDFAAQIVSSTPPSREQSLALTHLEEAVFWANAAISRNETPPAA